MLGDQEEHRPYEDYAVRHVMGSLDEVESGSFRSHLLDCPECRARVGELRSIASDLAEVERVERRERAAQRVETKEREADPDDVSPPPPVPRPARISRVLIVVGVLLIMLMSIWNFVLRGQNEGLRDIAAAAVGAAETINFGTPWPTAMVAPRHEGVSRMLEDRLAVMVRGTDDELTYGISMYDADGNVLVIDRLDSTDGHVHWFGGPLDAAVARVDVTLSRSNGVTLIYRALPPGDTPIPAE